MKLVVLIMLIVSCSKSESLTPKLNPFGQRTKELQELLDKAKAKKDIKNVKKEFINIIKGRWFKTYEELSEFQNNPERLLDAKLYETECIPSDTERAEVVFFKKHKLSPEHGLARDNICNEVYDFICSGVTEIKGKQIYTYKLKDEEVRSVTREDVLLDVEKWKVNKKLPKERVIEHLKILDYFKICRVGEKYYK